MTDAEFRAAQKQTGMTGIKLAQVLGTTPETICNWRIGKHKVPGFAAVAMLALASGWRP